MLNESFIYKRPTVEDTLLTRYGVLILEVLSKIEIKYMKSFSTIRRSLVVTFINYSGTSLNEST